VSTIKVDTYLTRGGASEIAIDKLKGASSANIISVVAEGGTTTTNLQQGLCKVWADYPGDAASITDSLNIASITDTSTGVSTMNFSNNFAGVAYSCTRGDQLAASGGTGLFYANPFGRASSSCGASHFENGSNADPSNYSAQFTGELA